MTARSKSPIFSKALFIFRRDLRLADNLGLIEATKNSTHIIPCFIFDPRQTSDTNGYRSNNAIQFMVESLDDLKGQISQHGGKLQFFYGAAENVVKKLIREEKINAVFCNKDYTPFSQKRDKAIKSVCDSLNVHFEQCADALLNEPENVKTGKGTPYAMFTPFYRHCFATMPVASPAHIPPLQFWSKNIPDTSAHNHLNDILAGLNPNIKVHGGTKEAEKFLTSITDFKNYTAERDLPALDSTTHLSAHLKFGTISIRQLFHVIKKSLGSSHPLLRQLYWRDFFYHIAYNNPSVFGHAYHKKYDSLWWENDKEKFNAWCVGKTGFPIVDAGMRELNTTGYMHNRVRMIVASLLIKDLHIDWQWGEKYFAQKLVDYDPAVNNGNWQWCASTGCDAQPYFRIFNPWLQQKRFDAQCLYIKKWIPELRTTPPKIIHVWYRQQDATSSYPHPIVDHTQESLITKKLYKSV